MEFQVEGVLYLRLRVLLIVINIHVSVQVKETVWFSNNAKKTQKPTKYMYTMQIFLLLGFGEGGRSFVLLKHAWNVYLLLMLFGNRCKSWVLQMGL